MGRFLKAFAILLVFPTALSFVMSPSIAQAKFCLSLFSQGNNKTSLVRVESPLHYKIDSVKNSKGNILLIHGLGDSMAHLKKISDRLQKEGYSVLRVDLHGHGKNLERDIANQTPIPRVLLYQSNVRDIANLVKSLRFSNPIIIGHSYGGAIAHALTSQLTGKYKAQKLVMMAPYLRRLDHQMLTGNPFLDAPIEHIAEQFMRETFRDHFESEKRTHIQAHIETAVATTIGIRNFDILSPGKKASPDSKAPMLVLGGSKDTLVTDESLWIFRKKLEKENRPHTVAIIEGDHFFPSRNATETMRAIMDFLQRD